MICVSIFINFISYQLPNTINFRIRMKYVKILCLILFKIHVFHIRWERSSCCQNFKAALRVIRNCVIRIYFLFPFQKPYCIKIFYYHCETNQIKYYAQAYLWIFSLFFNYINYCLIISISFLLFKILSKNIYDDVENIIFNFFF